MRIESMSNDLDHSIDIILCATQRCGSTLIAEDMRNCKELGSPEEYFIPWKNAAAHTNWKQSYFSICKKAKGTNGVSAIKIMANQLPNIEECLSTFVQPASSGDLPCFATIFSTSKWVWLKRDDVIAQAVSRVIAQQTGINHATMSQDDEHFAGNLLKGYTDDYNSSTKYNFKAILSQVVSINMENLCWSRFFSRLDINPLVLLYEDVIRDKHFTHIDKLSDLISHEHPKIKPPRKMVKLSNNINSVWSERFFEDMKARSFRVRPQML